MEDYIEILIYLLFIVASVVGGLYKNYAKKKEEKARQNRTQQPDLQNPPETPYGQTHQEPTRVPTTLEEFLQQQFEQDIEIVEEQEEFANEPEALEEEEEVLDSPVVKEGSAVFSSTSKSILSDNMKDVDFSITEALEQQESPIYGDEIKDENENINLDFNELELRKAIVYSEIINRKY